MPADMFLKLDGIQGESMDSKHKNEIEIEHYSFGVSQQGTASYGGGLGAGKVHFQDFHFSKRIDKATPNLFKKSADGTHISSAVLTVRKAGGGQQEYFKVKLSDVLISDYQTSGSEGAIPLETVTLNFSKAELEYAPQNADGSVGAWVSGGYDVKQQKVV